MLVSPRRAVVVLLVALFLPVGAARDFGAVVAGLCFVAAGAPAAALFAVDDTGTGIGVADAGPARPAGRARADPGRGAGLLTVLVSYWEPARDDRAGEYHALLLTAAGGMASSWPRTTR